MSRLFLFGITGKLNTRRPFPRNPKVVTERRFDFHRCGYAPFLNTPSDSGAAPNRGSARPGRTLRQGIFLPKGG
jgi:hypothetical protein